MARSRLGTGPLAEWCRSKAFAWAIPFGWLEADFAQLDRLPAPSSAFYLALLKGDIRVGEELGVDGASGADLDVNADGAPNWLFETPVGTA